MNGVVGNMYNAAYKIATGKNAIRDHEWWYTIASGLENCFPKEPEEPHLHTVGLVASATLQVRRLPASVEVVVICAIAAIADGRAISVLAVNIVITALG